MGEVGPLPLSISRFYLASLILCLEYLHSRQTLFRCFTFYSFKIDKYVYFWLYDLSNSERVNEPSYHPLPNNFKIGLPQWQPPESITQSRYSYSVDYWGLGIFAYVIIMGYFPFGKYQTKQDKIFKSIL